MHVLAQQAAHRKVELLATAPHAARALLGAAPLQALLPYLVVDLPLFGVHQRLVRLGNLHASSCSLILSAVAYSVHSTCQAY